MKFEKILLALVSMNHTTSGAKIRQTVEGIYGTREEYHTNCDKQDIQLTDEINSNLDIQSF